jgi:hypothetical protein
VKAAEQNGTTATATPTEREVAPETPVQPAQTEPASTGRDPVAARTAGQRTSGERASAIENADERDGSFGERDADRAADIAADLKSWMDTRREDRDQPREVL